MATLEQKIPPQKGETFGSYVRRLRITRGSAPYLNDIEKSKRAAPRVDVINALAQVLDADLETINDLAGSSKNALPPDIAEFIRINQEVISLLRMIKNYGLSKTEIAELGKSMISTKIKAVIVAAGLGSRLKGYTEDSPKCMLKFGDKTLLERQLGVFRECGINDISVVRGYKKEKINYEGLRYFENTEYKKNNILNSLFFAEEALNGNVIISYSDILFEDVVVKRLLESDADISIVVEIDWRNY